MTTQERMSKVLHHVKMAETAMFDLMVTRSAGDADSYNEILDVEDAIDAAITAIDAWQNANQNRRS